MLEHLRLDRDFDGMPGRIDVVDRQFFGGARFGVADVRLGLFPGGLPSRTLEPAALTPALGIDRRR
jgi:hypothetical protein